ncbi:hypothetical protein CFO_g3454 [Ceratocystis platani]|uniref:magnesium chelatase n=1 Tax=Ceratocystis fimbriata f. sp. platani TaxID=88771 RepID=A0A0F8B002_CERFI|nr:hypothetical protein CFO_g3454 [Ceratocystis platani]
MCINARNSALCIHLMSNDDDVIAKVHGLCDIELALLLSLVARENPIISTPVVAQNDLIAELQLALELLRTKRIFTRTMQTAPKQFMLIPVLAAERNGSVKLTTHLNDQFFIAHFHDPEDGFVYLGSGEDDVVYEDNESVKSTASVVKRSTSDLCLNEATFSEFDISMLSDLSMHVNTDTEVLRYQLNIAAFLRLHRAVASGISPTATKHLEKLCCCLAPLHRIDFVTPALVVLATRKVYPHRIVVATPHQDRSVQWGSDAKVIDELLEGFAADEVIEDVIKMVAAPV